MKVPIGHECQLCLVLAIRACPRQGETPLRLRAIIRAHRHRWILRLPKLTMRESQTRYDIYVNCGSNVFKSRSPIMFGIGDPNVGSIVWDGFSQTQNKWLCLDWV